MSHQLDLNQTTFRDHSDLYIERKYSPKSGKVKVQANQANIIGNIELQNKIVNDVKVRVPTRQQKPKSIEDQGSRIFPVHPI